VPVVLLVFTNGAAKVIDGVHIVHILFEHKNLLLGILSLFFYFISKFYFFQILPPSQLDGGWNNSRRKFHFFQILAAA